MALVTAKAAGRGQMDATDLDVVLFDVNETLSDLRPLQQAFESVGLDAHEVEAWFASVLRDGFALTTVGARPAFAQVASELLRVRLAARRRGSVDPQVATVMARFAALPTQPDVGEGFRALREAGVRVVTLSNGPASVAEGLLERAGVADLVERTLSVDDAPAWKPHASAYRYALDVCGTTATRTALVAVHPWDVDGATRAGLAGVWLNRSGAAYPSIFRPPDLEVTRIADIARSHR